ncbi:4-hydroxybenzoate octaprenyltransferase [Arsenicitalea aurantiaca]|uniref:4-hydroxybenzoate octaprenyltransferase n=1 Tax=Arsenicitalea aurantiaca TaxID=1783274 RepID=A0A433XAQ6_9HYPH|nr:4-hydroxybenzoate octaprenyltransferase [Arsenicitalea aurantiaca]RUT31181.1 4-hydroxybenzoate octaprenyltransferase [Arsenicitalea aurantiaca]
MPTPRRPGTVADAQAGNWVDRSAPEWLKPYARLARWDRPIGFWLLFWPCAFAIALAAIAGAPLDWQAMVLMLIGAIAMRGAGCTFNDIVDTDIDMKVARTRSRPIPSGQVSRRKAAYFLVAQSLVGLVILIQFNALTIGLGVASLALVAIYPFMKRITWWPQLFLGLAFSWGAIVGWTATMGSFGLPAALLYLGTILWVIGYDTIYALQDIEDDALIGVKSTARLFGRRARQMVALFYAGAVALWLGAGIVVGGGIILVIAALVPVGILAWQVVTLDAARPGNPLVRFKANHWVGLALTMALVAEFVL